MEFWDIYDIERSRTERTMVRGEPFKEGDYHLVIHVCIFNRRGEMLIQQRQSFKEGWPGMWDLTVGGSATKGDTSRSAASRETMEELGIKLDLEEVRPHLTINFDRGFDDIYLLEKDVDIGGLDLQYEEVQAVKWASKEEILDMIEESTFIPYFPSLINLLFEMRNQVGAIRQ
ncbi:NUDIX hydrolase [Salinicoccus sp. HZC-1]|uniref:NUDIX hydrolase n=1 Tax=Salinicoccus sp. HZC-1 TaxID=3385497 RepID=UPI00398AA291